ncbi:MAG: class I SAM-dependent methyltransferase [Oscillospiraceae bacterium]|nr:class I SAM-dependent methyltransferase [Oscillospiraceae bacterium]
MPKARNYYAAYEERYKAAHRRGLRWASGVPTPLVLEILQKYRIGPERDLLELGCGEGRDAKAVLDAGYRLLATDLSGEAIAYCKKTMPDYADSFRILDFLSDELTQRFDFIYAVAVVHMLVLDEDRQGFYRFIREHLKPDGLALICTMGDGRTEMRSDIRRAFEVQTRAHPAGPMAVAATSCRTVSFPYFVRELEEQQLQVLETGLTSAPPEFDSLMYALAAGDARLFERSCP